MPKKLKDIPKLVLKESAQIASLEHALEPFLDRFLVGAKDEKNRQASIRNQVEGRYNQCLRHIVPWVLKCRDLSNSVVAEIGCGTGASTAAFAHFVGHIDAYDIDRLSIYGAELRTKFFNHQNINLHLADPQSILEEVQKKSKKPDVILLYAVLEHMTIEERIASLKFCWEFLPPGGLLVVAGTPNRLCYQDHHTSQLPFFHMLPLELAVEFIEKSPRKPFAGISEKNADVEQLKMKLIRWGRGVSYHEFMVAFSQDNLHPLVLRDGFEKEIVSRYRNLLEQNLLQTFFLENGIDVPIGFSRAVLNIVFQKPSGEIKGGSKPYLNSPDRCECIINYESEAGSSDN